MPAADPLRIHVLNRLAGKGAHLPFEDATEGMPPELRGKRPGGGDSKDALPYSPWELVEHIRRAQRDILDFCRAERYEQPDWPDDYWPPTPAPPSAGAWDESCAQFTSDRLTMQRLVRETDDLHAPVPHATEETQTYLREALLAADHTSYHLGQLVAVRRLLDCWPPA